MTRDELIDKVATALDKAERENSDFHHMADVAISTIFAALKDSTEQMDDAARHLMMWLAYDRPTEHALHFMHKRMGKPLPEGCQDIDHVPPKAQQSAWIWQAMINASPLGPEGGRK